MIADVGDPHHCNNLPIPTKLLPWGANSPRGVAGPKACHDSPAAVATRGYSFDMETGVRELRDNLSRYIRLAESGERVVVKAHGRIVAELVPPNSVRAVDSGELERLTASGLITPPAEDGDPLEDCADIRLAPGTATALIDSDRAEA